MSKQHKSKSAKAESPLTPEAVHRAYRLAEECLDALCEVCGSARAVEETYQQADETNRRLFGHRMNEGAETARRWQMDVGVPKVVGVLAGLESATTPEMEDAACGKVGESYGLIGRRENSALVAVKNGIALIVKDQNAVCGIGWQCEGLLNNAKELRLALNAERVRVAAATVEKPVDPAATDAGNLDLDSRACGVLAAHDDWSDKKIAETLPCSRTSLYRLVRFRRAREMQKEAKGGNLPRGTWNKDRNEAEGEVSDEES